MAVPKEMREFILQMVVQISKFPAPDTADGVWILERYMNLCFNEKHDPETALSLARADWLEAQISRASARMNVGDSPKSRTVLRSEALKQFTTLELLDEMRARLL